MRLFNKNGERRLYDKESLLVMAALSLFLLMILSAAFLFVKMMDQRNDMLMQYTAEQTFVDYFFRGSLTTSESYEDIFRETDLRGLAAYDEEGNLLYGVGAFPERYAPEPVPKDYDKERGRLRDGLALYNRSNRLIEYTRRTMFGINQGSNLIPIPEYLYLAIDGKDYRTAKIRLYSLYGIFSLLIIFFIGYTWSMYSRNKSYRETLVKQKSLVSLGEAARTLAHEIKNPLSAITLQTAVLRKTMSDEFHKEGLKTIDDQVLRLNNLADRVREFIRNPKGTPEHLKLSDFLKTVVDSFAENIEVHCHEQSLQYVDVDSERLRSVFENLIRNGLEALVERSELEQGFEPELYISCKPAGSSLVVSVVDNGVGILGGNEENVFDPFFTTKAKGSGIGLAISRRFVEGAGGTLKLWSRNSVENEFSASKGTVAEVLLPGSTK